MNEPPITDETPEGVEENPVTDLNEEVLEISMEYEEQAVDLAMFVLKNMYTKNEDFSNEERREALKDVSHPDYMDWLEYQHSVLGCYEKFSVDDIEILNVYVKEDMKINKEGLTEDQIAVAFGFNSAFGESSGYGKNVIGLGLYENKLKLVSMYNVED